MRRTAFAVATCAVLATSCDAASTGTVPEGLVDEQPAASGAQPPEQVTQYRDTHRGARLRTPSDEELAQLVIPGPVPPPRPFPLDSPSFEGPSARDQLLAALQTQEYRPLLVRIEQVHRSPHGTAVDAIVEGPTEAVATGRTVSGALGACDGEPLSPGSRALVLVRARGLSGDATTAPTALSAELMVHSTIGPFIPVDSQGRATFPWGPEDLEALWATSVRGGV